jgi:2-polyprenyl-6-hydroxyphenyl methylase/3-demethylubiquinone-9 3-methyltransferase
LGNLSIDRVNEAYYGALGTDFSKQTRERINWIVTHVEGNNILDIGCSQGITSILLGREGKRVDGIDISSESIEYAIKELENEHSSVQQLVTFRLANFMTDDEIKHQYDTVLLTEVLEHISDPNAFLQKVSKHVKHNGKLIITVPFGINDYIDHKRTYYYSRLIEQVRAHFSIDSVEYLGKWIGVICKASSEKNDSLYSEQATRQLEDAFQVVEREYKTQLEQYIRDNHKYKKDSDELQRKAPLVDELKLSVLEKEEYIRQLQIETVELLNREEEALTAAIAKSDKIAELNRQISLLEHRYNVLKRSRFGRIQLKYWSLKKKIVGRGKK